MTSMDSRTRSGTTAAADQIVEELLDGELTWARTSLTDRRAALAAFGDLVAEHAEEWVRLSAEVKQLPADSPLLGEEWVSGPWAVLSYVQALGRTLATLDAGGNPLDGASMRSVAGGRVAIDVLPHTVWDRLLLNGFRAELWARPGVGVGDLLDSAGLGQRAPHETNGVALVLGAGNISSIAPLDVLYVLFADNRVAALKLNPIADRMRPVFERIFAPFIELGALQVISGGADIGGALAHHPGVAAVHMTGSEATHDAIVWGPGPEGTANKAAGTPLLTKPITSELGGSAPVIVVPGKWTKADLRFQARHIATQRLHNSGSNCIAAQIVIVSADWDQKHAFLAELRAALAGAPDRPAWYPGTEHRVEEAHRLHPTAERVGGTTLRTLITGLDLSDADESAFHTEYFGPVLGVAELPGLGAEFFASAVRAANDRLRGTLGANVVIHPRTRRAMGPAFDEAIAELRYGTIGVNAWTGVGYLAAHATWGAFPGHALDDIQSGRGVVHNAFLVDGTERTVVFGPFRPAPRSLLRGEASISPTPLWFVDNRTAATTGRRITRFAARPRWRRLPAIFASALRG